MADTDKKWSEFDETTTINNADILAIVQSGINKKITKANADKFFNPGQLNIVYRRANGSDLNDGLAIERAVATFDQAITIGSVLQPAVINCSDQSNTTEDIVIPTGIDINAPEVTINGTITIDSDSTSDYHNIILKDLNGQLNIENLLGKVKIAINDEIVGDTNEDMITNYTNALILHTSQVTPQGTGKAYVGKSESQIFAFIDSRWNGDVNLEAGATDKTNFNIEGNCNIIGDITAADKTKYRAIINSDFNGNITTTGTGIVEITCWERTGGTDSGDNIAVKELKNLSTTARYLETTSWIDGELIVPDSDPEKYIFKQNTFLFKNLTPPFGVKYVHVPEQAAKKPDNAETANVTYISVNSLGVILESTIIPNPSDQATQNSEVYMSTIIHQDHSSPPTEIDSITNTPIINANTILSDLMIYVRVLGAINLTPDILSPDGANLHLNKAQGIQVGAPGSFGKTPTSSFVTPFPPQNEFRMFRLGFYNNNPANFFFDTSQDIFLKKGTPTAYGVYNDITQPNPTDALVIVPAPAQYFILRFFQFPIVQPGIQPNIGMQYAQATYSTLSAAKSAYLANSDPFIENGFTSQNPNFTYIGALITHRNATNISADFGIGEAEFLPGAKIKGISGGAGASAIAYIPPDELNKLYINKVGNDSNNGKAKQKAFITPAAAYTAATAISKSATNRIVNEVTDDGYYSSVNLTINDNYIDHSAPYAIFDGDSNAVITIQSGVTDDNFIHVKRLQNNSTSATLGKVNDSTGTTHLNIGSVYNAGNGIAVSLIAPCEGIIGNIASEKTDNTSIRLSQATSDDYYCTYFQNVEGDILCEGNPKGSVIIGRQNGGTLKLPIGGVDLVIFDIASMPEKNIVYFQKDGYTDASNAQGRFINEAVESPSVAIAIAAAKSPVPSVSNRYICKSFDNTEYEGCATQSFIDAEMSGNIVSTITTTIAPDSTLKAKSIINTTSALYTVTKGAGSGIARLITESIDGYHGLYVPNGIMMANIDTLSVATSAYRAIDVESGATLYLTCLRGNGILNIEPGGTAYLDIADVSNFTFAFGPTATIIWKSQPQKTYYQTAVDYNPATLTTHAIIGVTDTSVPRTVTLSTDDIRSGWGGAMRKGMVKDESGGAATNNITVKGESGNINNQPSIAIVGNYDAISYYFDGVDIWTY